RPPPDPWRRAGRAARAGPSAPARHTKNPASAGFFVARNPDSGRCIFIGLGFSVALPVQETHHLLHDRPRALATQGRDQEPGLGPAQLGDDGLRTFAGLVLEHQVGLVQHQPARLGQQLRIVPLQLALDRAHLVDRGHDLHALVAVHRRDVDQVQQQAGALQVAQELRAEAGAVGGALDQARDVGDHEAAVRLDADHAQVRIEGGERISRYVRGGGGDRAHEGALAGIGEAQQADVGQQLQLQLQRALLARLARGRLARGAVGRALEVHVAQAALAAAGHQQALAVRGQVADDLVGLDVGHHGANRDGDEQVLAALAVHLPAHAVLPALGAEAALVAEVDQGGEVLVGDQPDAAAIAAVAAVRTAQRDELLAAEADASVAAIAGDHLDFSFVDQFHGAAGLGRGNATGHSLAGPARRGRRGPRVPQKRKAPPKRGLPCGPAAPGAASNQASATTLTVPRLAGPLVENWTLPSTSANSVWSRPRPTPAPGWNWVPRWRTMMLPASTAWPPNTFTPRYFGLESRPLREEPTPFLCAMTGSPY